METERSILDEIFSKPEEEIETFMEAISDKVNPDAELQAAGGQQDDIESIRSGKPHEVAPLELTTQIVERIIITHGWDEGDYVWHISTAHPKFRWKVQDGRLCYGVAKVMNKVIPQTCDVKIWLPVPTWEITEYTFKAMDLRSFWQITDESLQKMNRELFEVLNTMV